MPREKALFLSEGYDKYQKELLLQLPFEFTIVYSIVEFYEALGDETKEFSLFVIGLYVQFLPCFGELGQRVAAAGLNDFAFDTQPAGLCLLLRLSDQGKLGKTVVYSSRSELADESELWGELGGRIFNRDDSIGLRTFLREKLQSM